MSCHWTTPQRNPHPGISVAFVHPGCASASIRASIRMMERPRIRLATLAALALTSLASMMAVSSATAAPSCRGVHLRPNRSTVTKATGATLCLVNQARRAHHLKPFRTSPILRAIASGQSHEMLVGGYFGDDSLSGLTPMQRVEDSAYARGATRISVGQNIAWGDGGESTPAAIVASWLSSGPHREIMLSPTYQDVGLGISLGAPGRSAAGAGAIYTLDLAARAG